MNLYRYFAVSNGWPARAGRTLYHGIQAFSLPTPRIVVKPALCLFSSLRAIYYFLFRVMVCEPLFKAHCTRFGHNVRTGVYVHWVQGAGQIVIGDDVIVDGKSSFLFAAQYSQCPTLTIGSHCYLGHGCQFTVGKAVSIGSYCRVAAGVKMLDAAGHPTDPASRRANRPAPDSTVRPVVLEDNVWVGTGAIILPGVTIGEGSVVGAAAVVTKSVPPNTLVAGNPARPVRQLRPEE